MADIKQAAKWMQEGKAVIRTRPTTPPAKYEHITIFCSDSDGNIVDPKDGREFYFRLESILADDWEIAQ